MSEFEVFPQTEITPERLRAMQQSLAMAGAALIAMGQSMYTAMLEGGIVFTDNVTAQPAADTTRDGEAT